MESKIIKIATNRVLSIILLLIVLFSSCTKEGSLSTPSQSQFQAPPPTFTCMVNGKPFNATSISGYSQFTGLLYAIDSTVSLTQEIKFTSLSCAVGSYYLDGLPCAYYYSGPNTYSFLNNSK